jgi:pilus assembly protein CpaF
MSETTTTADAPVAPDDRSGAKATLDRMVATTIEHLLAPVAAELSDPSVSEVMINGFDKIYVERDGKISRLEDRKFDTAYDLEAAARSIAQFSGKRLGADQLSVEARLPDGSRIHIMQAPASRQGLCISVRRFRKAHKSLASMVETASLTAEAADFLRVCVVALKNIVVSGGTGTGKTTLLGALAEAFDDAERIIVIEDVKELDIAKPHVLYFEAQRSDRFGRGGIGVRQLFQAALRMRPDRIIVGECRGGEAIDMIQAMTSGHTGSLSTLHANDPRAALQRLETMALMSDLDIPLRPLRAQIVSAVDLVIQIVRQHGRRFVSEISEVCELDAVDRYELKTIYRMKMSDDGVRRLSWTGERPTFAREIGEVFPDQTAGLTRHIWHADWT